MSMDTYNLLCGPGFVGFTVGMALYGVGIAQFVFYVRGFPHDKLALKSLVFIIFILDNSHTATLLCFYYHILVGCRSSTSPNCLLELPLVLIFSLVLKFCVTFIVHNFYAHRVWIISGRNRILTAIVILSSVAQLVFGSLFIMDLIRSPTYQEMDSSKFIPLSAIASAVCDVIITASIAYYLRPARTDAIRRGNYIKQLNNVFVQMGLFSCINAFAMAVLYYIENRQLGVLLTAAPGVILGKTYVNSMLGVLNARKSIREQQQHTQPIDLPTIRTIR